MRKVKTVLIVAFLGLCLSGCAAVLIGGAAGAGGGYVYKQDKDKQDVPWPGN